VLYHGPISRREIDYVRGVNSAFILRNLLVRGLVEKTDAKEGERSFTYKPTLELLSHLGVTKIEEFPEYEQVKNELREFNERLTENKDE
jgi:segregation and condensation protein B